MSNNKSVEKFLLDVYGYGKIDSYMRDDSDERGRLDEYLKGTIIGTFRRAAIDTENHKNYIVPVKWPRISQLQESDLGFQYSISNRSYFRNFSRDDVELFFQSEIVPLFFQGEFGTSKISKGMWEMSLDDEDIKIVATGSYPRINSKGLYVDFNASEEFAQNIQEIVRKYSGTRNALSL